MKKLVLVLLTAVAVFAVTGCDFDDPKEEIKGNFWAQYYNTRKYYRIDAEKLAENLRCEVWVEKGSGVTSATAKKIADEYITNIYPKMMQTFGYTINDRDLGKVDTMQIAHYLPTGKTSGAKLTILLLDIKDGYQKEGDPYVAGYFTPYNLFKYEYSNVRDMIYMDTYPSDPDSTDSFGTLAHEMQHLMNFVSSVLFRFDGEDLNLTDTWVDEGLSGAAEWVYSGQHPEERWGYYNKDRSRLIAKGNNFFVWDNHNDNPLAILDDYATVYLFFQYLRLQSAKPNDIYIEILTSEHYDYQAVTTAEDINSHHKNNWQLLLRDWHAANYTNATTGLYGYKNDSILKDIKAPIFPLTATAVDLFPGEGVYSITNTAESVPTASGNIKYAGLSSTGSTPNDTTGFANGARLTYNVNTVNDDEEPSESGSTTGIAPPPPPPSANISISAGRNSAQIGSEKFSRPFKVDAGYFLRKGNSGVHDEIRSIFNGNNSRSINKNNNIFNFDRSKVGRVFIDE
jgi:hypothetical protein